jgi:hypothetical protein
VTDCAWQCLADCVDPTCLSAIRDGNLAYVSTRSARQKQSLVTELDQVQVTAVTRPAVPIG